MTSEPTCEWCRKKPCRKGWGFCSEACYRACRRHIVYSEFTENSE